MEYWRLSEGEGLRLGVAHGLALVEHGDVEQVEGFAETGACQFVPSGLTYLGQAAAEWMAPGGAGLTAAGWVFFDAVAAAGLIGRWDTGQESWQIACNGDYLVGCVKTAGSGLVYATLLDDLESGGWYYVLLEVDRLAGQVRIRLNNSSQAAETATGALNESTAPIALGKNIQSGDILAGRLCAWGVWSRLLTTDEKAVLYNLGSGLAYPWL